MLEAPELHFHPGLVVKEEFHDYKALENGAKNYQFITKFRLGSGPFYGIHAGIQLKNMQLGYADRHEGLIYEGWAPKECITIGILKKSERAVNVNRIKVEEGEILVLDDSAPHHFISAERAEIVTTSIQKSLIANVVPQLLTTGVDRVYRDREGILFACLSSILEEVATQPGHHYTAGEIERYEQCILDALSVQFETLEPVERLLNEYESIAFDVKDHILENLKEDFSITALTEQFAISDKSLEKHFSALFGITPKKLITMFKLNQVHEELCYASEADVSVTDVAIRWGFSHLSRFSNTYKDVFGTFPSEDLKLSL